MIEIPDSELVFRATRASGPGGQHVNKTASRVELVWKVTDSTAVTDVERVRLLEKLATRLDSDGNLRVVASATRSQLRNRDEARERLHTLVEKALAVPKPRKKTKTPFGERQRRLESKRQRSQIKAGRKKIGSDE